MYHHGLKGGWSGAQNEIKRAVEAGYWQMYRFNPELKKEGKNPFTLDSKEPTGNFREFLLSEVRYSSLQRPSLKSLKNCSNRQKQQQKKDWKATKSWLRANLLSDYA